MSCHTPIPENRWYDFFPKSFVNTHIHKKSMVELFARYEAQLPAIQDGAEMELRARKLQQVQKRKAHEMAKIRAQLNAVQEEYTEIGEKISLCREVVRGTRKNRAPPVERIVRCMTANCNAFLDKKLHCSICKNQYCLHCHELKHDDVECNSDKVLSVQYIKQNTRACPKCSTAISKTEGCDQMFCVVPNCDTFFSYTTGKEINSGPLHNPYYIERLRQGGVIHTRMGQPGANAGGGCNALPHISVLQRAFQPAPRIWDPIYRSILNFHRSISHITGILDNPLVQINMRENLIYFLIGNRQTYGLPDQLTEYNKDMFMTDVKKNWKVHLKKTDERVVLSTCRDVACDIFNAFLADPGAMKDLYDQCRNLATITNSELEKIAACYVNKPHELFGLREDDSTHLDFILHRNLKGVSPWERVDNPAILRL
jgi:hypothetical protein